MPALYFLVNYIYYPIVKYRIHISVIFFFLLINIYTHLAKEKLSWPIVTCFFLWHYALYIFDRAYDYQKDAVNQPKEAILPKEKNFFLVLSIALCLIPLPILIHYDYSILPYLPFIPITFLYTFPLYKNIRSKNITFFKNIYSALFIWTLPLAVVAYFYTNTTLSFWEIFKTYFLGLFIYVMVGEAFWDIRDVNGDRIEKVNTLPVVFGVNFTKIYLILLILIDLIIFGSEVSSSTVIYVILILVVNPNSPRWLFHIPPLLALYRFIAPLILD